MCSSPVQLSLYGALEQSPVPIKGIALAADWNSHSDLSPAEFP